MEMRNWKKVMLQWITQCGFTERNYFNIEQTDIDIFYEKFASQHQKIATQKLKNLTDFLKEFYPEIKFNLNDENCLSSTEYVYVYSLLLHFSCVTYPESVFHEICKCLPAPTQESIREYFKKLIDIEHITKEALRDVITEVANAQITPPHLIDSFSSGPNSSSSTSSNSTSFLRCDSPSKTPKRCVGTQRISPPTPKSYLLEERTRELYSLKAKLETQRYEKDLLETQIKQNEDEIEKLKNEHKKLIQQIQDLRNELFLKTNDGSSNDNDEENQIQKQILKELSCKEEEIIKLSSCLRTLREEKELVETKLNCESKKFVAFKNNLKQLEDKIDELNDIIKKKDEHIQNLVDNNSDLERFISEMREYSAVSKPDFNASGDCLDNSFLRNTSASNSHNSAENLGVAVIDLQLREKEYENKHLKEELQNIHQEHARLTKNLTKLAKTSDLEDFISDIESKDNIEEISCSKQQISCQEQFAIFNNYIEKIDMLQQSERNKFKQLEQKSNNLQKENENLTIKLNKLTQEVTELKQKLTNKLEVELAFDKSQTDLANFKNDLQSLQNENEKLNETIKQLKTKLELQNEKSKDLLATNEKLDEDKRTIQTQLTDLEQDISKKTLQWEEKVKKLNEQILEQTENIEEYKKTEQKLKSNYEQILVNNEELKQEARQANAYLCDVRNELKDKQNQLTLLGQQINNLKQKNVSLEKNINTLVETHSKEIHTNTSAQTELHKQLEKCKDQLSKTKLLMDSKHHECELKQQSLDAVQTKMNTILKLCIKSSESNDHDDVLSNTEKIHTHFVSIMEDNESIKTKFKELTKKFEDISCEFENKEKETVILKANLLLSEQNIKQLQNQQACVVEKAKHELMEKENELQERLKEASAEYEASMDRIAVELKLEKQYHNEKEMELIVCKAELNDAKTKLNETTQQLQQNCELLKQFETRVMECSKENNQLRSEIVAFQQQVTQNALRLIEADKALAEFIELTKDHDVTKTEVEILQNKLKQKDTDLIEMQLKLQQQSLYEEQVKLLQQQLEEHNHLKIALEEQLEKLTKDKERLIKEGEEKVEQISRDQQDKLLLINSLEKSADQLKVTIEEKQQQSTYQEQKLQNLQKQYESLSTQNTELEAELAQEKQDFQQKIAEKSKKLELVNISLAEIKALIENNFNLRQELLHTGSENVFNYQENKKSDENIQQLRKHLNCILFQQENLNIELENLTAEKEETLATVASLKSNNKDLFDKLEQQEKLLKQTQEQLYNEELIVEKRSNIEIKRLEEDLLNLEKVNERVSNENVKMQVALSNAEGELKDSKLKIQFLEEEILKLKEEIHKKSLLIEKLQQDEKKLRQTLKEKSQQMEKLSEKSKQTEIQLKDKTSRLQSLEKEYHEAKNKAQKSQQNQQVEQKKLQEKCKSLQSCSDALEVDLGNVNKELLIVKNKNCALQQKHTELEQELNRTSKELDEMLNNKLNAEIKSEKLQSDIHQLKRDLDFIKTQQQTIQEENNRLNEEVNSLKLDKKHLRDEVLENKLNLKRANENVTQLIQQMPSIRLEKEAILKEKVLLRKQLDETGAVRSNSETKMKSVVEKSQDLERKLLAAENELKALKVNLEKSEKCAEKLQAENKKLRDSQEVSNKRVEKFALKLGDSQAKSTKLERDNEKLSKTLEAHTATVEALNKEKDLLQAEAKTLKERLCRAERGHEQLAAKVQNLEHINTHLQQIKQKLEASEIDGKYKLEKMRDTNEEKMRKLTTALNNAENANVKLNLEIGGLNSQLKQLKEIKAEHHQENLLQIEELNHKLTQIQESNEKYEEMNEKLKTELKELKEENSSLNDQLSKASLSLQITSQKCERFTAEMEQIRAELLIIRQEKSQIQMQHETSIQKINEFKCQNTKIVAENKNLVETLEQKITQLEKELQVKMKKIVDLQKQIEITKDNSEYLNSVTQQTVATADTLNKMEDLRRKLSLAEEVHLKEQQIISQLRSDYDILNMKYQNAEDRIKENRLELEGKLEKMKNKMKTLYVDEVAKIQKKHDRELAVINSEMEVLKAQINKYEEHTRKLSNQIVRLNDNILQQQKENTILSTKLKHANDQLQEIESNKRCNSIHVSITSSSTANIAPNLAMEDEEGEVFNNTYLADLKNGRMSELMAREICVEELKHRNSLWPPHLRSAYAAQFDHELPEDDLKDGLSVFDDSMSALLSTTGATRKKCTGITHYKRPGPPTPSKNGRLSLNCGSEPTREILKEYCDTNIASTVSSTKTPARFNFFSSRFSMGNTRDEKSNIKKEVEELNLKELLQKTKIKATEATRKLLSGVVCTSTPRKSKVHFDQRRLLDQLIKSSPSPSPSTLTVTDNKSIKKEVNKITAADISIIETPLTALDKYDELPKSLVTQKKIPIKRLQAIAGGLKHSRRISSTFGSRLPRRMQEICTPTSGETTSSALSTPATANAEVQDKLKEKQASDDLSKIKLLQKRFRKRRTKEKGSRPSLCLRGNIFSKYRTPKTKVLHDLARYKSRKQRHDHFNKRRNIYFLKTDGEENEINRNKADKLINCKCMENITYDLKYNSQKLVEDTFTFGEEQFEQPNDTHNLQDMQNYESEKSENLDFEYDDDVPVKQTLVTSQDLENFDRFINNFKSSDPNDDNYMFQENSKHFEKLLLDTESNAPFDDNQRASFSKYSLSQRASNEPDNSLTSAKPHLSSSTNTNCHLSRTIYGGTVIYNHRLPHINTTHVRKSSIYIKNRKKPTDNQSESSSINDVVLITNQTINFVDIICMWSQMDNSTRIIISFLIIASFVTLCGLFVILYSRY